MLLSDNFNFNTKIPLLKTRLHAGFPSPAEDYFRKGLDLNDLLIKNPETTFAKRVEGNSWSEFGIYDKDIIVIDRSLPLSHSKIVSVTYEGEFTLRRIGNIDGTLCFLNAQDDGIYFPIDPSGPVKVWGVVRLVVHIF